MTACVHFYSFTICALVFDSFRQHIFDIMLVLVPAQAIIWVIAVIFFLQMMKIDSKTRNENGIRIDSHHQIILESSMKLKWCQFVSNFMPKLNIWLWKAKCFTHETEIYFDREEILRENYLKWKLRNLAGIEPSIFLWHFRCSSIYYFLHYWRKIEREKKMWSISIATNVDNF